MRVAWYQSTDPVNRHVAKELAAKYGTPLWYVNVYDANSTDESEPFICDFDSIPDDAKQLAMAYLTRPSGQPRYVHSYNLDDDEIAALHARGVAVHRRLDEDLFASLARTAAA